MTVIERQTFHDFPSVGALRRGPLIWCAGVFVFALLWQYFLFGVNTDTSWIITVCERMLAGDRLYVDILEVNPPMTMWIYMPVVMLAHLVGIAPEAAVYGYIYLVCLTGLGFAAYIARRAEFEENPFLYAMLPVFLALLVVLPAYTFSQREHFGVALLLPLLTLMAWRVKAGNGQQPGVWLAVAAGLCGSMIVLVKPYYAIMIVAPALYVAWRKRSMRWLFTAEYWTIACACGAYLAAVPMIYPEYLRDIVPVVVDIYSQHHFAAWTIIFYGILFAPIVYSFYRLHSGSPISPLVTIVMISSIAGLGPLIYQGKGFPYHALPAFMLGFGALACTLCQPGNAVARAGISGKIMALAFLCGAFPFLMANKSDATLVRTIRERTVQPTVGVIGTSIEIGHPLTRMIGGVWTGQHCSDWLGGLALYFASVAREAGDGAREQHYDGIARNYIAERARVLKAEPPQILLLQKDDFWADRFVREPALAGFMNNYRLISEDKRRWVFLHAAK
ncbi:MAG: hypothetical protein AB7P20_16110 [Rhizobiaceae bacterium]